MLETLPDRLSIVDSVGERLIMATQAAALASKPWIGSAQYSEDKDYISKMKNFADQSAVDAIYSVLGNCPEFSATVVMGEGDKDEAPMLAHGDILGANLDRKYDLAVDPIDGTTFVAKNKPGGISVIALASPDSFPKWENVHYAKKLIVGPNVSELMERGKIGIDRKPRENMERIASHLGKYAGELVVVVLDRPRNKEIIKAAHEIGSKLILIEGGDVVPGLLTCDEDIIDLVYSSGGWPEAVVTAAGVATRGGNMQVMHDPQNEAETLRVEAINKIDAILGLEELVGTGDVRFAMTAITRYLDHRVGNSKEFTKIFEPGSSFFGARVNGSTQYVHRDSTSEWLLGNTSLAK